MDNLKFQKLFREHREQINSLDKEITETFNKLTEGRFNTEPFKKFFMNKLKKTGLYDDKDEIKNEAEFAIDNMKYDMKQGTSLFRAFDQACMDLHIEADGIESYL